MLKFTVITVCCNRAVQLEKTMKSVFRQTYQNIEYLIIDGASTDGTASLLSRIQEYRDVKFYSEEDYGIYNAMNRGTAKAAGDYIIFLNAGDTFYSNDVLEKAAAVMGRERNTIYYGKAAVETAGGVRIMEVDEKIKEGLSTGWMPCHQSIFAPACTLRSHYFNEKYRIRADFEWLAYCVCRGIECRVLPFAVCCFAGGGVSSDAGFMQTRHDETQEILGEYLPTLLGEKTILQYEESRVRGLMEASGKYQTLFRFMAQWISFIQKGMCMKNYFESHKYRHIAVYGLGLIGECFVQALKGTSIEIAYAIDRDANKMTGDVRLVLPDSVLEQVDAIVVTAITDILEIRKCLNGRMDCAVVSIKEILDEMMG